MPITAITYTFVYLAGVLAALIADPTWGICLYEVHYFFNPANRWWHHNIPGFFTSFLISSVILLSFALNFKKYSNTTLFSAPQAKWLVSLFLLMCIVGGYALWPEKHWEYLSYQFKLLIILAVAYKVVDSPSKLGKMLFFYLLGVFYLGWEAYVVGRTAYGRVEGIGTVDSPYANDTAALMVSAIPILLYYLMSKKKWQQGLALIAMAYICNGVILVNSRGAFLGIVVATFCFLGQILYMKGKQAKVYKKKLVIFMLLCLYLFLCLADNTFWDRMFTLREVFKSVESEQDLGRMYFWFKAFDIARDYPFGTGVNGFQYLSPRLLPESSLTNNGMRAVHSTPFQVLAEYGYIGLALFIGLIISNFALVRKMKRALLRDGEIDLTIKLLSIESGFVAFLTSALFIDRYYCVVLYWMMLFIACFYNVYFLQPGKINN